MPYIIVIQKETQIVKVFTRFAVTGGGGSGLPNGGTTGQYLRKSSATNGDAAWANIVASEVTDFSTAADARIAAASVDALVDVTITTPVANQVFKWNGSAWVNANVAYSELTGVPSTFPPSAHTHTSSDITDFVSAAGAVATAVVAASSINDLADVTITSPATNSVLKWNGSAWIDGFVDYGELTGVPATFPPSSHTHVAADITDFNAAADSRIALANLADLLDVSSGASNGQFLKRGMSFWAAHTLVASDMSDFNTAADARIAAASVNALADVTITTPAANQVLKWNGSAWVNASVAYSELTGVPSTFAPSAHATSHQHGGADEVATATPGNNAIPKANGSGKLAVGWISGVLALDDLTDVTIATPATAQVIRYNGTSFVNAALVASDISDATTIGKQVLTGANAAAIRGTIDAAQTVHTHVLADVTDFPNQSGNAGKVLKTNGTVPSWTSLTVQTDTFTSGGTYTKPAGAFWVEAHVVGGGGGGGSGRRGAAGTNRSSGVGGGGGAKTVWRGPASLVGATETITVGAAGTGGAAITADSTNGNAGTNGGDSSFGSLGIARGGLGGPGGSTTNNVTAPVAAPGSWPGGASQNGTSGSGSNAPTAGGGGGGGPGGGITSLNAQGDAGNGGGAGSEGLAGGAGGTTLGTVNGSNGSTASTETGVGSGGGGGAATAGTGGAGGGPGGGGGGGGASSNGTNSGAGGNGASGKVVVYTFIL
ncbi:MAG: hypothetical protein IT435_02390 [Phycisphaerales bacterium]|nr:hypothetical protein [Phycisphaerales bacterium]